MITRDWYNVMFIDGADNCAYDVFCVDKSIYNTLFPSGRNICFIEDLYNSIGEKNTANILSAANNKPILKELADGIHGILFFGVLFKKDYYPNLSDEDLDNIGRSSSASFILQQQRRQYRSGE